jgi:hypothetical protein
VTEELAREPLDAIIHIAIAPTAFEAIAATLPWGSIGFDCEPTTKGEPVIWIERQLDALRGTVDRIRF